ncbi:hypothetical protein [Pseudomonas sp. Z18(2022)]|uniref:hypothetical protein n=1 Tax=Pseudomonas sp. Z18(2022) TaxID=2983410 RepID=UPI002E824323|nr:hypothetical protein [Pseudomonas sp. Z18(2022)]
MKVFQGVIGLSLLSLLFGCSTGPVQTLKFNVPHGYYGSYLKQKVGNHGQLTCNVTTEKNNLGEEWVSSVILGAGEDDTQDNILFLSSYPLGTDDQRAFQLRLFNKAQRVTDSLVLTTPDHNGVYSLRLAWADDGSISYQVASGGPWSEKKTVTHPGFSVRQVSMQASGIKGTAVCELAADR